MHIHCQSCIYPGLEDAYLFAKTWLADSFSNTLILTAYSCTYASVKYNPYMMGGQNTQMSFQKLQLCLWKSVSEKAPITYHYLSLSGICSWLQNKKKPNQF